MVLVGVGEVARQQSRDQERCLEKSSALGAVVISMIGSGTLILLLCVRCRCCMAADQPAGATEQEHQSPRLRLGGILAVLGRPALGAGPLGYMLNLRDSRVANDSNGAPSG